MLFYLFWDVVLAVIVAVLFGVTLASPGRSTAKTIAFFCFLISIFTTVIGVYILGGIALGVP